MWNDIVLLLLNLSFKFFISVENFALLFQNYTSFLEFLVNFLKKRRKG